MKKCFFIYVIIFLTIFSSTSYSEQFVCSYLFQNESRSFILERKSTQVFQEINFEGSVRDSYKVLFESEKYLILGGLLEYGANNDNWMGYETTFIDKEIKSFQSHTITEPKHKDKLSALISGNCIIN